MLSEGAIGNIKTFDVHDRVVDEVPIDWFDTEKHILKLTSLGGRELGVRQPDGARVQDGDVLYADGSVVLAARIKPCTLLRVSLTGTEQAARLGYELGNRHLPIVIGDSALEVPYDEPTAQYLQKLGFAPERVEDVFKGSAAPRHHAHHHDA